MSQIVGQLNPSNQSGLPVSGGNELSRIAWQLCRYSRFGYVELRIEQK